MSRSENGVDLWDRKPLGVLTEPQNVRVGNAQPVVMSCTKYEGLVPSNDYFRGRTIHSSDISNYKLVRRDWLAYATNHLAEGSIGIQDQFDEACVSPIYTVFSCAENVDPEFLFRLLKTQGLVNQFKVHEQATVDRRGAVRYGDFAKIEVRVPVFPEQRRVADILYKLDEAIRSAEEVIAKLDRIRRGLLNDLLTRGIDQNGMLRDPEQHPEQFKDTLVGKVPVTWRVRTLGDVILSAVDGPFGSNLKTAHYVESPGIRVVRLQNIGSDEFLDGDRAYVAEAHAMMLQQHDVRAGDLLVASMGDENHPIARGCLYPAHLDPGIVKADCFRLRADPSLALNSFISLVLSCSSTRSELQALAQGVTRDRVNLGNLMQFRLALPSVDEQANVIAPVNALKRRLEAERDTLEKLRSVKLGLSDDLLSGRVRVTNFLVANGQ